MTWGQVHLPATIIVQFPSAVVDRLVVTLSAGHGRTSLEEIIPQSSCCRPLRPVVWYRAAGRTGFLSATTTDRPTDRPTAAKPLAPRHVHPQAMNCTRRTRSPPDKRNVGKRLSSVTCGRFRPTTGKVKKRQPHLPYRCLSCESLEDRRLLSLIDLALVREEIALSGSVTGVTVITHGYKTDSQGDSLLPLADAIHTRAAGTLINCDVSGPGGDETFEVDRSTPSVLGSNEVVVLYDWAAESNEYSFGWAEAAGDATLQHLGRSWFGTSAAAYSGPLASLHWPQHGLHSYERGRRTTCGI